MSPTCSRRSPAPACGFPPRLRTGGQARARLPGQCDLRGASAENTYKVLPWPSASLVPNLAGAVTSFVAGGFGADSGSSEPTTDGLTEPLLRTATWSGGEDGTAAIAITLPELASTNTPRSMSLGRNRD